MFHKFSIIATAISAHDVFWFEKWLVRQDSCHPSVPIHRWSVIVGSCYRNIFSLPVTSCRYHYFLSNEAILPDRGVYCWSSIFRFGLSVSFFYQLLFSQFLAIIYFICCRDFCFYFPFSCVPSDFTTNRELILCNSNGENRTAGKNEVKILW